MPEAEIRSKPILIFDGECDFCRAWITRWHDTTGDTVEYQPYQEVGSRFPEISESDFKGSVQLVEPDGSRASAAAAVFGALANAPGRRWPLWLYRHVPGFAPVSELAYSVIAAHRPALFKLTRLVWGRNLVPPGERLTAWIFLRVLAILYLIAFVSIWTQISGLAGSHGILPARDYLQAITSRYGTLGYWIAPTLGWISTSDGFLQALCAAGAALSILLAVGAAPIACLTGLWVVYLSVSILCQEFFWFQWDGLLIETSFLAVFLAPWKRWSFARDDPPPARISLWLLRWLLVRLSISSAAVKLASGDPTWRNRTALQYHFETQPLPTWTAWYVHHFPAWILHAATAGTVVLEGLAPILVFAPRRIRFLGAGSIGSLQALIFLTGNYCFFNLLALALCILLLDDGVWPRRWREWIAETKGSRAGGRWFGWLLKPIAILLLLLSLVPFVRSFGKPTRWLGPIEMLHQALWPFRIVNSYGLFAVMTTRRPEIVVEGSADGVRWIPYEFRFKPGDPRRRPDFVAPHQPRLDWQMWFAAMSDFRQQPWFLNFCGRLLEGSPPVSRLLARNPFPLTPPRFLRAIVYDYHFTDSRARRETGAWWRRSALGLYCPVLTLSGGRLVAVVAREDSARAAP